MNNLETYERLIEYIHSAIESEQPERAQFNDETEKRLTLVYSALARALGVKEY